MGETKKWNDLPYGFDRTQGFKEAVQPVIQRTTALSQTIEVIKLLNIQVSVLELFNLQKEMFEYLETGETTFFRHLYDKSNGKSVVIQPTENQLVEKK